VLSLSTDRYHSFDGPASRIWQHFVRHGSFAGWEQLEGVADLSAEDVDGFVAQLQSARLIDKSTSVAIQPAQRPPRRAAGRLNPSLPRRSTIAVSVVLINLATRLFGTRRVLEWIYTHTESVGLNGLPQEWIRSTRERLDSVAGFCPGDMKCLPRGLTLLWLLRRRGLDAKLRFGVQTFPFRAHVWVDLDGQPVNELPEHLHLFQPFPACEPGRI